MNQYWISVGCLAASAPSVVTSFTPLKKHKFHSSCFLAQHFCNIQTWYRVAEVFLPVHAVVHYWLSTGRFLSMRCILLSAFFKTFCCCGRKYILWVGRLTSWAAVRSCRVSTVCLVGTLRVFVCLFFFKLAVVVQPLYVTCLHHGTNRGHCYTF